MKKSTLAWSIAIFLLIACLSVLISYYISSVDFSAFYCGGASVAAGADPYRLEPLRTCEHATSDFYRSPLRSQLAIPAPFPGYDLAFFALLSHVPYRFAFILWQLLLWGAVAATILMVWRLAPTMSLPTVGAVFLLSDGYASSLVGQLAPFSIVGITFAAWCVARGRVTLATLGLLLGMCEPHIGLGAFLAFALFIPGAPPRAALGLFALAALTYLATGTAWTFEYVHDLLPHHILSEITFESQYSLTSILHLMAVPDRLAVQLGELSYVVLLVVSLITAKRLRDAYRNEAFIILIPCLFSVIGGPFIHITQIAVALPAVLLLYANAPGLRPALGWSVVLLAVAWTSGIQLPLLPFVVLIICLLTTRFIENRRMATLAALTLLAVPLAAATIPHAQSAPRPLILNLPPTALSTEAWQPFIAAESSRVWFYLSLKLPTWCGLLIAAWAAIVAAKQTPVEKAPG